MGSVQRAINKIQEGAKKQPGVTKAPLPPGGTDRAGVAVGGELQPARHLSVNRSQLLTSGLAVPRQQEHLIAEQFRGIKRPLISIAFGRQAGEVARGNMLLVTSAVAGEGKSFSSFNLALSMAREKDRPVILVDADVGKPHLSEALGARGEPGLLDLLGDGELTLADTLLGLGTPGLMFMPCGTADVSAHELLASRRMEALASELADSFPGMVVLDSPPLLQTHEARVLTGLVGQVLLVVAAGRTPQAKVVETINLVDEDKALNLMLNGVSGASEEYSYGSAYRSQE